MISDKALNEYMEIYKKEYGKDISKDEAIEQATNLLNFFNVLYDCHLEETRRKSKLVDNPKGYHLNDGKTYNCCICHQHIKDETTWYDKNGNKCLLCQKALDRKIIPASVCHDSDSWYSLHDFEYYFGIKAPVVRKLVKDGHLKSRVILDVANRPYFHIFLIKDNKGVLPPKPQGYIVTDDKGYSHTEYYETDISALKSLINSQGESGKTSGSVRESQGESQDYETPKKSSKMRHSKTR